MNRKLLSLVLFVVVSGLFCAVSCTGVGTLFGSRYGVLSEIKKDALMHEYLLEKNMFANEPIIFGFDDADLSSQAKTLLIRKVEWLISNPNVSVIAIGQCDFLGDEDYNLVLGKNRAKSVKSFMLRMGIEESRLSIHSLGENDLVSFGETEEDLIKNRRVIFSIIE